MVSKLTTSTSHNSLQNKNIIVGMTGGIAAYKAVELVRLLIKSGADVRVVMTQGAQAFITPLTIQAVSGREPHTDLLDPKAESGMGHIELSRWADLIIIAPASANIIAQLAQGSAEHLLTTICLATQASIAIAPAMNQGMWQHDSVVENLHRLKNRHISVWGPAAGEQACGDVGPGRLLEPSQLLAHANEVFSTGVLAGKKVVITAGPTREAIDPVRYISNHSSGKMGYAIARSCVDAGAKVTLVSGPVYLPAPEKTDTICVTSVEEMLSACDSVIGTADIFIATAAVVDYKPKDIAKCKIKKTKDADCTQLELVRTPDILKTMATKMHTRANNHYLIVGFAAETNELIANAKNKLVDKQADLIVANDVSRADIGFNQNDNAVTLVHQLGEEEIEIMNKQQLAKKLVEHISVLLNAKVNQKECV